MVTKEEIELVKKRMEAWNEKIGRATFRNNIVLTKDEMLKHIELQDELGIEFTEVQLHYLRKLKERAR